ncbi:MAG: TerC family protein [Alphaproteobacteria bacterium]|nr:TerC family protein [Alphaproteobacteria bacterium]
MLELLSNPDVWLSFATLAALEVVLGIDNLVFISIVADKLPKGQQARARQIGLMAALGMRVLMLLGITWIVGLTAPVFTLAGFEASWRDIILLGGGIFLLVKGTLEIHHTVEGDGDHGGPKKASATFLMAVGQIMVLDLVFSLDSIITAVGMTDQIEVMIAAVVFAILVMLFAASPVSAFIHKHPTTKMLALSFLLLIGMSLVADGLHFHIPREYLYFAIAFSIIVEGLNLLAKAAQRRKAEARANSDQ